MQRDPGFRLRNSSLGHKFGCRGVRSDFGAQVENSGLGCEAARVLRIGRHMCIYISIHTHTHTRLYIYTYASGLGCEMARVLVLESLVIGH